MLLEPHHFVLVGLPWLSSKPLEGRCAYAKVKFQRKLPLAMRHACLYKSILMAKPQSQFGESQYDFHDQKPHRRANLLYDIHYSRLLFVGEAYRISYCQEA